MKLLKKVVSILLVLCVCIGTEGIYGYEKENDEPFRYVYPITPEDEEWDRIDSVEEKIEACRIPQELLNEMTNEELYQAIMDFPFLCDIFVATSQEEGVESLEKTCDAYRELLSRDLLLLEI